MFRLKYKRIIQENIRGRCDRHPRYNPETNGKAGITDKCSTCYSLLDLHLSRLSLEDAIRDFERRAAPWEIRTAPKKEQSFRN
jgi:hypothetical protein